MTLDKRLAALVAALDAREQETTQSTEDLEAQVALLVAFMRSDQFDRDSDVIVEPTGPHAGAGCQRCTAIYKQQVTIGLITAAEHASSATTDIHPISEKEWRSRGRWWPDNADITCLAPTFALLALED